MKLNQKVIDASLDYNTRAYLSQNDQKIWDECFCIMQGLEAYKDSEMQRLYPELSVDDEQYGEIRDRIGNDAFNRAYKKCDELALAADQNFARQFKDWPDELHIAFITGVCTAIADLRQTIEKKAEEINYKGELQHIHGLTTSDKILSLIDDAWDSSTDPAVLEFEQYVIDFFSDEPLEGDLLHLFRPIWLGLKESAHEQPAKELLRQMIKLKWTVQAPLPIEPFTKQRKPQRRLKGAAGYIAMSMDSASRALFMPGSRHTELNLTGHTTLSSGPGIKPTHINLAVDVVGNTNETVFLSEALLAQYPGFDCFDERTFRAVITIIDDYKNHGIPFDNYCVMSTADIWREFSRTSRPRPTKKQAQELWDSIQKMGTRRIHIYGPLTELKTGRPLPGSRPVDQWAHVLDFDVVDDGSNFPALRLLRVPPLYAWALQLGHIERVPKAIVGPSALQCTHANVCIEEYLLARVLEIKRNPDLSHKITYEKIYLAADAPDKIKPDRAIAAAKAVLDGWIAGDALVFGYEQTPGRKGHPGNFIVKALRDEKDMDFAELP